MTGAEPTVERRELGERVMGIIGGYRMGTALNAEDLFTKTAPEAPPSDTVLAGDERRTPLRSLHAAGIEAGRVSCTRLRDVRVP